MVSTNICFFCSLDICWSLNRFICPSLHTGRKMVLHHQWCQMRPVFAT